MRLFLFTYIYLSFSSALFSFSRQLTFVCKSKLHRRCSEKKEEKKENAKKRDAVCLANIWCFCGPPGRFLCVSFSTVRVVLSVQLASRALILRVLSSLTHVSSLILTVIKRLFQRSACLDHNGANVFRIPIFTVGPVLFFRFLYIFMVCVTFVFLFYSLPCGELGGAYVETVTRHVLLSHLNI